MIPQATIDRIIDSANIVDVVSEYVTLRRSGANYKGLCPFHDDKTPSFMVSASKGICKCFSCGVGGNAVHFIMQIEQLTYYEALRFLAKKQGIEIEDKELTPEQRQSINERESMFAINEWASKQFYENLKNDSDGRALGLAYFRSRGFRDDIIERFRLGFSLDRWDGIQEKARKDGYKDEYLVKTGLCYRKDDGKINDRFRGRVMFPWFNVSGKVVAFGGRVLDSRTKGVSQKYVNSPESEIYSKARELYGIFQAKKQIAKEDCVYMVEGYTDVISMHQCGIENVVANSGTALTQEQIRLLHRYTNNIVLLYDGDAAGIHAALRGTDMLLAEGINVKILLFPDGDDPDSFARKHNSTEFKDYINRHQTDFIIFKTNLLLDDAGHDPIKKANLTKDIVKSISVIPEEIVRSTYIHECSEMLQIDEAVLLRQTQKDRAAALEEVRKEAERARERAKYLAQKEATKPNNENDDTQETQKEEQRTTPQDTADVTDRQSPTSGETNTTDTQHTIKTPAVEDVLNMRRQTAEDRKFEGLERLIMRIIIRYGADKVKMNDDDDNIIEVSMIEFVRQQMELGDLHFRTPIYTKMLSEVFEHQNDEGFNPSRYLTYSPDEEISREAVNLLSDRYQLSSKDMEQVTPAQEMAPSQIEHIIYDYKFACIETELKQCKMSLTSPEISNDDEACKQILQRIMELSNMRRGLAKELGERVLLK